MILRFAPALCAFAFSSICGAVALPGFAAQQPYNEQVRILDLQPSVTIAINAPAADYLDREKPTRLILYALPNGNTTSQTIGRRQSPDLDWHYFIQQIGAQTRRLRELVPDENVVVAYAENSLKSWPTWRSRLDGGSTTILSIVNSTTEAVGLKIDSLELTGHSGGGSFIFGFINGHEIIPSYVKRLAFLDANYGYSTDDRHAAKLIDWLERTSGTLVIYAYDDREVTVNGKKVVSATGGTHAKTHKMAQDLGSSIPLTKTVDEQTTSFRGLDGHIDMRVRANPENAILHTVLVEKNGFIQAVLAGTKNADRADPWFGETRYEPLIAP